MRYIQYPPRRHNCNPYFNRSKQTAYNGFWVANFDKLKDFTSGKYDWDNSGHRRLRSYFSLSDLNNMLIYFRHDRNDQERAEYVAKTIQNYNEI